MLDSCQELYSLLGDDESKELYLKRIAYSISGDKNHIKDFVRKIPEGQWFYELPPGKCDYIFGCNTFGKKIQEWFPNDWCGFVDNNFAEYPYGVNGLKVFSPTELPIGARIFLGVKFHADDIISQLVAMGIESENIINVSQKLLSLGEKQYFDLPYLPHPEKGVFVDLGAFDGYSSQQYVAWNHNRYDHIYCFEPDSRNVERCQNNLRNLIDMRGGVSIIRKAAYDKEGTVQFEARAKEGSRIGSGKEIVETTTLDRELFSKKVTFIKMDIEGAEMGALRGAKETIERNKPTLAISIYHLPEDIIDIPKYLLGLDLGYQFYLRHYSLYDFDTVLYAIP